MSKINILSPFVSDLIAAGEVVERPGSVVKELMENALDADAKNITVEVRGGGVASIRVTDDGVGMSPEDAGICFLRHATSKLSNERDLERIGTLGFRGEALAAIAAVSKIELTTRLRGSGTGTKVLLDHGEISEMWETGCPEGTTIHVRDLFFNTPARQKFLKSDRAEGANCLAAAQKIALGSPSVSIRCISDGKELFQTPGNGDPHELVYNVLGRDFAMSLLAVSYQDENIRVSGLICTPKSCRGNRGAQYFYCNGRNIRAGLLQAALERGYKNALLPGRFPSCVLYLELAPNSVDVNVHPAKTEVKFSSEKAVFDAIFFAVTDTLEKEDAIGTKIPTVPGEPPEASRPPAGHSATFSQSPSRKDAAPAPEVWKPLLAPIGFPDPDPGPVNGINPPPEARDILRDAYSAPYLSAPAPSARPDIPIRTPEASPDDFRVVGEAMATYIVVESGQKIIFIDKHAAHERMLFDAYRETRKELESQALLFPVTCRVTGEEMDGLAENEAVFASLGFEIEPFGDDAVLLRAVPMDTDAADAGALLDEIVGNISLCKTLDKEKWIDELYYSIACKAAIKAGRLSEPEELRVLALKVLSGEIKYCPHGRPVSFVMTKKELDKEFRRI